MRKLIILAYLFLNIGIINGQSISISTMRIFGTTITVVPVKNQGNGPDGTDNAVSFSYEHFIKNKRYSIFSSYIKFNGCTLIYFEPNGWIARSGTAISGYGFCGGVKIHRFDIGITYNLFKQHKKIFLKPCAFLGIQKSITTGVTFWRDGEPVNGPNYFELEPMNAESRNTTQLVPSIGFRTGFVFWKRLEIGLGFQAVHAFKSYQVQTLNYQYKGVVQPTAIYKATGTGLFVSLGIGYRFAKLIK
ncbi:MAG: hypothetical protein ACOYPR_02935 [Saprospiraceae bacterium]|jgi:hypothetical protein